MYRVSHEFLAAVGMGLPVELVVVLSTTVHALLLCTFLHELYSVSLANAFALQLIHSYSPNMSSQQSATVGGSCLFIFITLDCMLAGSKAVVRPCHCHAPVTASPTELK